MKSHKLFTLFLVLVAAVLLAACGGAAATEEAPAEEPADAPAEEPAEEAAEEPAEEGGSLSLAGSTSVQPLAEVLALAYMDANPGVVIDVQGGGSSAGVTAAGEGTADIGDASRSVKDSEFETYPDIIPNVICLEGIAVVTNPGVDLGNLSLEQVYQIFSGEVTNFADVGGPDMAITVVAREEGSGTRDAFDSAVFKPYDGELTADAILQSSNGAVRTTVAETKGTIAYLAMGYIDESTNLVNIDGVEIGVATVQDGSYPISRPFNMITNGEAEGLAAAFLDFVLGAEGQAIIEEEGYVLPPTGDMAADELMEELSGSLSLAGSTSVQPLAEVLALAFMEKYPDVVVDVQGGGSSAGVTAAGEGTADIGDASRSVKDSEMETYPDLIPNVICLEGIAVVTNPSVEIDDLTMEQVYQIFSGEVTNFSDVGGPDMVITVVAREEGSGTRDAFDSAVFKPYDGELTAAAILQSSNGAVRTTVAETEGTIAYLAMGYIDESTNLVNVEGVEISAETVKDGSYPISRPFNMITNGEAEGLAAAFLDFVLGADGQEIVEEEGYVLP